VPEFTAAIMDERSVEYFRCTSCRSLMLPNPDWLDAAYSRVIVPDPDFGALRRSMFVARFVRRARGAAIIPWRTRSLDYGSGHGILVRLLRDRDIEAYGYDRYARARFAEQFCGDRLPEGPFDLITCIEVIEHTVDPVPMLRRFRSMLGDDGLLVLSTELVDTAVDARSWSYLGLDHGQHITLFSRAGLTSALDAAGFEWLTTFALHGIPLLHIVAPKGRRFPTRLLWLRLRQWLGEAIHSSDLTV
jgi:hypothetical protein